MFAAASDFPATTITVEPMLGNGANGIVYGPPTKVTGYLNDARKLVRAATGDQVVSSSTFYTDPGAEPFFPPDSRVTLPNRQAKVIVVNGLSIGDPDVDHVEVNLT